MQLQLPEDPLQLLLPTALADPVVDSLLTAATTTSPPTKTGGVRALVNPSHLQVRAILASWGGRAELNRAGSLEGDDVLGP